MNSFGSGPAGRRLAWAYLSSAAGEGPAAMLWKQVRDSGPVEAAEWLLDSDPIGARRLAAAHDHLRVVAELGARLVTPDDEEWPADRLAAFTNAAGPQRLAPLCLWTIGARRLPELTEHAVTVTGTRAPTSYGAFVTAEIVGELATAGWTTVGGGGFGVDAAAHRAALAAHAPTLAVLPCGIDLPYPVAHTELLRAIAEHGAVVSEYPPGTTVARSRLIERTRLLAGFADAVVIPEAGVRSGARAVAAHASALARPVFAIPGPVTSAASTGCHDLIRSGQARLATHAGHVLDVLDAHAVRTDLSTDVAQRT